MQEPTVPPNLIAAYDRIRSQATQLAGEPGDLPQRAAVLHSIYLESGGNHTFPQVALHGALWASVFFSATGTLGKIISYRYFYSPTERRRRHGMLTEFSDGFKTTNRSVFIDTYSNYYFSRDHGTESASVQLVPEPLLVKLNRMHQAVREGDPLTPQQRKELFAAALQYEQEATVAPGIKESVGRIDCPILTTLLLKPLVRFRYFRPLQYFLFRDFSNTEERIAKALRSHDIAEAVSWDRVVTTMRHYGVLPQQFFADPAGFVQGLKESRMDMQSSRPDRPF